jgi:hypothetical protein
VSSTRMSDLFDFRLPDIGEDVAEAEIVEWKVRVGEVVAEDQDIVEVMTEKATMVLTSSVRGTLHEIVVQAGQVAPVGAVLCRIDTTGRVPPVPRASPDETLPASSIDPATTEDAEYRRPPGQVALCTPYTRRLARELGVDIERVRPTGELGRVVEVDVRRHAEQTRREKRVVKPSAPAPAPAEQTARDARMVEPAAAPPAPTKPGPCRVFISANQADYPHARLMYDLLTRQGIPTFFSPITLPDLGNAEYAQEIDRAIESAEHMVVVASSRANVESQWVESEWRLFDLEKRSGRKRGNLVTILAGSMQIDELPIRLRHFEVFRIADLSKALRYIAR